LFFSTYHIYIKCILQHVDIDILLLNVDVRLWLGLGRKFKLDSTKFGKKNERKCEQKMTFIRRGLQLI
jgi:hypothetical protein